MPSYSPIERVKPLLGTFVHIRVAGLAPTDAHFAIDAAFTEVATIHRLMSFHDEDSDVSRLNRDAYAGAVEIDPRTYAVLTQALKLSMLSAGAFDITVAAELVERGVLPERPTSPVPDNEAIWSDVVLLDGFQVRFRKQLWIDLGGIAKGFAVDRAVERLLIAGAAQICVNAGGDLRVAGPNLECIQLAPDTRTNEIPIVELADGSLASSSGAMAGRRCGTATGMPHVAPAHVMPAPIEFVSVVAPRCIHADALTKVVMARGVLSRDLLVHFDARAIVHDLAIGWREIEGRA